ncbi:MAG: hypothetical protein HY906_15625 [Deltaproteobacteria bacterium]|nr:hypothetical protein [Deltaproteobacteria bacterium]
MRRPTWLVLLALCVGACGGRSLPPGQDDGAVRDGAVGDALHRDGAVDGPYRPDGGTTGCTVDTECAVAVRTDNCCQAAYPELVSAIAADPCLELWSAYGSLSIPRQCLDKWDPQCAVIDCMPAPPPSRVARCDRGACEFAIECVDPTDCTVAIDTRSCCPCPTVVPAQLLDVDRCLVKYPQTGPAPSGCAPQACPAMPCPACPPVAAMCMTQTCESGVR